MPIAFSGEADAQIAELLQRYPEPRAALLPALWVAQRQFGYLTIEVMKLVATRLGIPESHVVSTATFYTMFHKRPIGRCHVQICKNISCYLRGADELFDVVDKKLGIGHGETSRDNAFTLEGVECLAACGRAPVVRMDEDYHEWVTPEDMAALLERYHTEAPTETAPEAGGEL